MQFTQVTYPLTNLISNIELGSIGLPEIQRPFVWKPVKVRDLFDSMYRGFPVGFLLFWHNVVEAGAKTIGTATKQTPASKLVVDGQQRLTSLYAVMKGQPVLNSDFQKARIQIAFRPSDEKFDVMSAAIKNDAEWIPDISVVWQQGLITFVGKFLERLRSVREVGKAEEEAIGNAIERLQKIQDFHFTALELASSLDEEEVAEIFVRINSEGVKLNQADFILTLMSVWWEKGRKELEEFCRDSRQPSISGASPFNWFIQPNPDQLLRAGVAVAFGRARLQHVYSILRGKDLETGEYSAERRTAQFEKLSEAQSAVLDLNNWHEFFHAISAAGYRGGKMVMSETNLMYTYAMFLIGLREFGVDKKTLRRLIARWFFMTSITSRYTGSSETQMESDLARVRRAKSADEFVDELDRICDQALTNDYWEIRLPNDLERSGTRSPMLYAYEASQVLLGAPALFSNAPVTDLIDPAITGKKSMVERHHLFPRGFLKKRGLSKSSEVNQIANYALVEWAENISIGAGAPSDYYSTAVAHLDGPAVEEMEKLHALPRNWFRLAYPDFLEARRELMAEVIRSAWQTLGPQVASPELESSDDDHVEGDIHEVIRAGESAMVEFKSSARWNYHRGEKGKEIEDAVVKTVAAFMNSRGGTLLIGVNDEGEIVGLEPDFATVKGRNRDGFDQWIHRLLTESVGSAETANLVIVQFYEVGGKTVCRVDVDPSHRQVYAKTSDADGVFYVRTGAATVQFTTEEATQYIADHWRNGQIRGLRSPRRGREPAPISTEVTNSGVENGDGEGFDWSELHELLRALPSGRWTTYGDLATLVGTSPHPLGSHLRRCQTCENEHRVLNRDGEVSDGFTWGAKRDDDADPMDVLADEGVAIDDGGRADPKARLSHNELAALLGLEPREEEDEPLTDLETLVTRIDEPAASRARAIAEDWESRDGTWSVAAKNSLVLFAKNPRVAQRRCHVASLSEESGGSLWLNPGRIRESGAFGEAELGELDRLISDHLPATSSQGKGYYQAFPLDEVTTDGASVIFDFVLQHLA